MIGRNILNSKYCILDSRCHIWIRLIFFTVLPKSDRCRDDKNLAHFYKIKEFWYSKTEVMLLDIEWREGTFMQLRWSSRWNAKAVIKIGLPVRQFFFQPLHLPCTHAKTSNKRIGTLIRIMRSYQACHLTYLLKMSSMNLDHLFSQPMRILIHCSICWINWHQKLKLKTKIFFVWGNENLTTFLYTLNKGDKNFFLEGDNKFSCPLFVYYEVEMSATKEMVFSFSFWFQFIQRIEQRFVMC